jgi:catechol 2,3-dioxygenase-like lactoylglutathione lyase family enzyme
MKYRSPILAAAVLTLLSTAALADDAPLPKPLPFRGIGLSSIKIGVAEFPRAVAFYSTLGLKEGKQYNVGEKGMDIPNTGLGSRIMLFHDAPGEPPMKPGSGWIDYDVPDVSKVTQALAAAGYKDIGKPFENKLHTATFVLVKDPDGNTVELIQRNPTVAIPMISAVKIGVSDLQKSATFYTEYLGFKEGRKFNETEQALEWPDNEGHGPRVTLVHNPSELEPGTALNVFVVPEIDNLFKKIAGAGYKVLEAPKAEFNSIFATVEDPYRVTAPKA